MQPLVYLDNAATTFPKPAAVHDAVREFYTAGGVNPGRSGGALARAADDLVAATRRRLSALFNPSLAAAGAPKDPNRLVFTHNGTMSLNLVIHGCVRPGEHIVATMLEHNSVIRPINHLVRDHAVEATFVAPDDEGMIDPDAIKRALQPNTTLVIVNHASNVTGVVQDLSSIGDVCRQAGVRFAVDAAQTAGVVPLDMAVQHIDFVAFTGHKGLLGPTGTGGVCVADHAEIRSTIFGGTGVRSAEPLHPEEFPHRLEAGTLNLAGIAGLSAALDWLNERGIDAIHAEEMRLLEKLQTGLAAITGVRLLGTRRLDKRVATLAFTVDGFDPEDVATILEAEYNVLSRAGLHCAPLCHEHLGTAPRGAVRFSLGPLSTEEEIDAALRAVRDVAAEATPRAV
jgi:cysteine desulfurase family protein